MATISGLADPTTEPTWNTSITEGFPGGDGNVAYRWVPAVKRKLNDFGKPSVAAENGHYYQVTYVDPTMADINGYGTTGATALDEPTPWPTTGGSITDNGITWTDQGLIGNCWTTDSGTEWQRLGPVPTYAQYGKIYHAGSTVVSVDMMSGTLALSADTANYETILLKGSPTAAVTLTIPSVDGWSGRIVDLTSGAFAITMAADVVGGSSLATTNGATQRMYIYYDSGNYNLAAESPAI